MRTLRPRIRNPVAPAVTLAIIAAAFFVFVWVQSGDVRAALITVGVIGGGAMLIVVPIFVVLLARRLEFADGLLRFRRLGRNLELRPRPGWRLVEYRRGAGRYQSWQWFLFDEADRARLRLDAALYPRDALTALLADSGVSVMSEGDLASDPFVGVADDTLVALSDEAFAELATSTRVEVPPYPRKLHREP